MSEELGRIAERIYGTFVTHGKGHCGQSSDGRQVLNGSFVPGCWDPKRRNEEGWLNDEMINVYVALINEKNKTITGSSLKGKNVGSSNDDNGPQTSTKKSLKNSDV